MGMKFEGFYRTVVDHLRERGHRDPEGRVMRSTFSAVLRLNNLIVRHRILARHNYVERRADGSTWAADTRTMSSLVLMASA